MYIVYNLLFTITINIEHSYNHTNTARWPYRIIRLHKFTQVQYLSFGKSLGLLWNSLPPYIRSIKSNKTFLKYIQQLISYGNL